MASSSFLSPPKWTYDVFLSFRGEDTRTNFVDHLYTALDDRGISTFKDDQKLQRGKPVAPELLKAIEQSRFSIVVFSKNYAVSSWCLDELVRIIDCKESIGQIVLPVFYDVDPSQVRKQTGCFGEAFAKHENEDRKDENQIRRWRNALAKAASISGWNLPNTANGHESQCIKQIVGNILMIVGNVTSSNHAQNFIGMESQVQNVKSLLLKGAPDKVHIVGIWGMGGAGKTTLARAVFNDIANQFDSISFVANIRQISASIFGLHSLQKKVLLDILMEKDFKVSDVNNGINMMSRLCHRKVLLVLDDVDHVDQLEALVGKRDWFGKGSRIIITTKNEHLLVIHDVNEIHRIVLLNDDESLMLFNRHAFKSKPPLEEYADLSITLVNKVGGLPLALKVLGSDLYGRGIVEWEDVVDKLMKHKPNKEILSVLKISYDGLERNEQDIFLDIACFFLEDNKDDVLETLDSFSFNPGHGLTVLVEKCLVDVFNGTIQMHDMIKELAWEIVYQRDPKEPGKRSRLWRLEDINVVFENDTGTEAVEGIKFVKTKKTYNSEAFKNMRKLRLLDVSCDEYLLFRPVLEYLSNELCFVRWTGYPSESLPPSFESKKLVYLRMQESNIVQLWEGRKFLDRLKLVDLSHSAMLTTTPDLSGAPNLEKLILRFCEKLEEVHPSLGELQRLTFLDLFGCESLKRFRFGLNMTSLEILILRFCSKFEVFPQIVGDMKRLRKLNMEFTAIQEVHPSIEKLTGLVNLNLSYCDRLRCLPSTIGHLKCLKTLDLSQCPMLRDLPKTLQDLECLEELYLSGCPIEESPSSILLSNLNTLSIGGYYNNKPTSLLTCYLAAWGKSLGYPFDFYLWKNLSVFLSLKILKLQCPEVPSSISQLSNLEQLYLSNGDFTCLPDSLCQLSRLRELELWHCMKLRALPKLPSTIAKLSTKGCVSLENFGDLLTTKHESLHYLCFVDCPKLMENEQFSGKRSFSTTDILLQRMLKRRSIIKHDEFNIVVPGTEIPDWISIKLEGYMEDPSLELKLLPHWETSVVGFAMSCNSRFDTEGGIKKYWLPAAVTISLGPKCKKRLEYNEWWRLGWNCDHIWVWYVSLDHLRRLFFGDAFKEDYWVGGTDATFFRVQIHYLVSTSSHKNFGIRVVYKDDVKHFYNGEEGDLNTSS